MKVLFLSWAYPKESSPYLGIWAHQQALALRNGGVDVEVVNSVPFIPRAAGFLSGKIKKYSEIPSVEKLDGVTVYHPKFIRVSPNSALDEFLFRLMGIQTKLLARRLRRQIDVGRYQVLHAHNIFPDGAIAYRLHRKYGIPYVLTLHDVDRFHSYPKEGPHRELGSAILSHASKVLAVSNRVKSNIREHVPNGRSVELLYNTFWTQDHLSDTGSGKRKRIVTLASLIKRKGVHELLRAFREVLGRYPDYELMMIGQGSELGPLKKAAEELGVAGSVTFTGAMPHADAMKELARSSIFCLASWDEAFGVAYAEAMSYGLPVIGCRGEGIADVVTDGVDGLLVEPRNAEELARALFRLIEHPEEAERIGSNGRERIRELRPEAFGRKLAGIYEEILLTV
ncbi:glycosyltransferase [Cohnella candidum]|uniref:Glycosyltransferase family 4 protein n=1 Tax=Cohnella candidum TaxID=2674991 RepID=A0A3G3K217_9BACL|nr:glycosyltransferase [Cohnella candidum]AYQ73809.1 glycosyltransferase family 4 protein [Cohnella candidum]